MSEQKAILGAQQYPLSQIYSREGRNLADHSDEVLAMLAECGLQAWEPFISSPSETRSLGEALARHGLSVPSMYANVRLHEDDWADQVAAIVEKAAHAVAIGTRVLVVNPEPIDWNQPLDKNDAQLRVQGRALQNLGKQLTAQNQQLAYHIHAPEMRQAAREFHHMMLNTDANVGLCLDTHWIYRGAGNSQVALDDIIQLYGSRIVSLHLRQSGGGVWSETLGDGDIAHSFLVRQLEAMSFSGPIIMEQAIEAGTPQTMSVLEAHRQSAQWARRVFGGVLAG